MASQLMARPFAYDPRRFQWLSRLHVGVIVALVIAAIIMLRISTIYFIAALMLLVGAMAVVVSLLVTAVPPMVTKHQVTGDAVILKQGAFFEYRVPFTNIKSISKTDELPSKPGILVLRGDSTLYVLANLKGTVELKLKESQKYKGTGIDRVIADFDMPEEFLTCVKERMEGERLMSRLDRKKKGRLKRYPRDPLLPPPKFKKPVIGRAEIPDVDEGAGDEEGDEGEDSDEANLESEEELGDIGEEEEESGADGEGGGETEEGAEDEDEKASEEDDGQALESTSTKRRKSDEPEEYDDGLVTPTRIPPTKTKTPKEQPKKGPASEKEVEEYVAVPAWGGGAGAEDRPRIVRIPKRKIR